MLTALCVCLAVVAPTAVLGTIFALPRWAAAVGEAHRRRLRRLGRLVSPSGPPIEQLASDLRRLRVERVAPHRSRVQREGARRAYEDVLHEAAAALGVSQEPAGVLGFAREVELLRLEQALLDAGLRLAT